MHAANKQIDLPTTDDTGSFLAALVSASETFAAHTHSPPAQAPNPNADTPAQHQDKPA